MTARRKIAALAAAGVAPLALTALSAAPAAAHGSMTDPVSRVSACFQEGPESPTSAACKAAVAASGAQAFYDWNGVNIANAAGKSKEIIPDGKLCSAGNDKYQGLDLPRADWPSSKMTGGNHTFRYKGTAPHKGSFELYITKDWYDPTKPLKWSDLEEKPFVDVADPKMENGDYVFDGKVPAAPGRHLIYSVWQRSDSPEAFYTCSDVVFGKDSGGTGRCPRPRPPRPPPRRRSTRVPTSRPSSTTVTATPTPQPAPRRPRRPRPAGGDEPRPTSPRSTAATRSRVRGRREPRRDRWRQHHPVHRDRRRRRSRHRCRGHVRHGPPPHGAPRPLIRRRVR